MVVVVVVVLVVAEPEVAATAFMLPRSSRSSPAPVGRQGDSCHNPAATGTVAGLRSFPTLRHRRRRRRPPAGPTEGTVVAVAVAVVADPADSASAVTGSSSSVARKSSQSGRNQLTGGGVSGGASVGVGGDGTMTGDEAVLGCASTVAALACPLDE